MIKIYPKTIFINEDGELMQNDYDKTKYHIKKQWYEKKINQRNEQQEGEQVCQRYVVLEKNKWQQLEIEFD